MVVPQKITLVGTALNLREKMRIYPQVLTSVIKLKFDYFTLLCPLNMQIFDVPVAVFVVVA